MWLKIKCKLNAETESVNIIIPKISECCWEAIWEKNQLILFIIMEKRLIENPARACLICVTPILEGPVVSEIDIWKKVNRSINPSGDRLPINEKNIMKKQLIQEIIIPRKIIWLCFKKWEA